MIIHSLETQYMSDIFFPKPRLSMLYQDIEEKMSAPGRAYHNMSHIRQMLKSLRDTGIFEKNPLGVNLKGMLLAIHYHDIVQEIDRSDNEEASVNYMRGNIFRKDNEASLLHYSDVLVAERLILATKHDGRKLQHYDEQLIHDLDLVILGQLPEKFAQYEKQLRKEYLHISNAKYRRGRMEFLERRLGASPIYLTQAFRRMYEDQARENIIESLTHHI
jgi:predicted metal-dependent HD superfamily phosphohydrolase